ncbi:MAG: Gfo/Idh/MocA family oxidoreductase [Chitinophagaceae bacterium]
MKLTKWGIIGPGNIAHTFVNDLSFVKGEQRVTAVLGHNTQKTFDFAKEYDIPDYYSSLDDFLKNKNMDAVYIATPHPHHYEQALACLQNKIPVLCEKPMTINADQCRHLIGAAKQNNTFLMEGMWIRFLPSIQLTLRMIQQGLIGKVTSLRASMSFKAPHDSESRFFDPELGGGSLLDLGIYPVFLALLIMGKPCSVKAIGKLSEEGVDEACSILLHYKNGSHATLESSLVSTLEVPAEIVGEKGIIKILNPWFEKAAGIELQLYGEGKIIYPCHWEGHGLYLEIEEVIKCVENGQVFSELLSHDFSLHMIKILDEIRNQINVTYDMYE